MLSHIATNWLVPYRYKLARGKFIYIVLSVLTWIVSLLQRILAIWSKYALPNKCVVMSEICYTGRDCHCFPFR